MKAITHCHLPFIIFSMLGVLTIFFGMLSPSYAANDDLATTISVVNGYYPQNNNVQEASAPHHSQKIYAPTSEVTNSGRVKAYSSSVAKYNDNKERRAKAKLTKSQRHTRHKCSIDQFLGTYFYSGGCGGMSFEMNITCEHDNVFGHHQLCKFEERSVS